MTTANIHYTPAQNVTVKANVDIAGGRFVEVTADLDGRNPVVKPATAGAHVFGVTAQDVKKDNYVMVYRSGHILDVAATGSIKPGGAVAAGKDGTAVAAADNAVVVGIAMTGVNGGVVTVALK